MLNNPVSRRSFLAITAMTAASLTLNWKKIMAYASKMGPKKDYPVVIIGAGLGGLCCGAYLAKQGIPVTVVEQHTIPGGYATSFDRSRGKFSFEVSLHGTSINENETAGMLKDLGILDKLSLAKLPEVYFLKTPDHEIHVPQQDPESYIRLLSKHFPSEKEGIAGFMHEMTGVYEETEKLSRKKGNFIKILFPVQYKKMWDIRNKTLADFLEGYVKDPALKNILSALWGYYGLPPSRLSAFYYAVATGGYLKNGSFYIKDRSQNLSNLLADVIENSGGKIIYGTKAEKIITKNNSVTGVITSGGKTLPAKAVVSNASAITTFNKMLEPGIVPDDYLKKLESYRPSISCFTVWLGLNKELRGKIKTYSTHISSGRGPEADYASCLNGDIQNGSFGVTIYDNVFKGYSKPGTSTLMLLFLCGYEPWRKFEQDYDKGSKRAYRAQKNKWTDILIKRAEKTVIPQLASMIEVKEAATPLTNRRYTGNTEGAIYGFEQSMDNAFMNRIKNVTPVKGLFLASAWGDPGGGYGGVLRSGQLAFQKIMES